MWVRSEKFLVIASVVIILASRCLAEEVLRRRQRRMLAYPTNSCTGILVALAIPLGLEHRSVFMSYNFEANYNMPTTAPELIPGPLTRLDLVNDRSFKSNYYNRTDEQLSTTATPPASFISREKIYKLIESKINGLNLNGKKCLLRLICEAAEAHESLFKHNGVMGDLLNILLTPSSTRAEGSPKYHNAEVAGRKGECESYREACVVNLLDYFTSVL